MLKLLQDFLWQWQSLYKGRKTTWLKILDAIQKRISLANVGASAINVDCYINDGSNDIYLVKDAPIPTGSAIQVLDGGAKVVVQSGDRIYVKSDTASSLDVWVSVVDAIST
mgnify:CR=1 FL=1